MADLTPEQQATLDRWQATLDGKNGPLAEGDYLPNPDDAHSFYQVAQGRPILHQCPIENTFTRQVFNPELNVCDWSQNVSVDMNPAPRQSES